LTSLFWAIKRTRAAADAWNPRLFFWKSSESSGMATRLKGSALNLEVCLSNLERTYALVSPLLFKGAHIIERIRGASREELQSRLGYVPVADAPVIWFHGASAGEMAAAAALCATLRQGGHRFEPVYTATNRAGTDYVRRVDPRAHAVSLVPWDTRESVARALDRWKPRALLIVETELWPLMVFEACARSIPVFSVSARIYPADVARYRAIKPFIGRTLKRITRVLAQDEVERRRFIEIGAPAERCLSVGNLKYINARVEGMSPGSLRAEVGLTQADKVVICGSIHADEAAPLLDALKSLPSDVRVIIAPRHLSAVGTI
jgi:3-deoxy-D-manno-octulosonic-acid transferase